MKKRESPWITESIIQLIRNRDKQKKRAKESKLADDWKQYRVLRNRVTSQIRVAKREYISASVKSCQGQSGDIWKALQCILPQKNKSCGINQIKDNGVEINDKNIVAEKLNCYFANIGKQIQNTIVACNNVQRGGGEEEEEEEEREREEEEEEEEDDDLEKVLNKFEFKEIKEKEVLDLISCLQENKASGLDNIPVSLIKPIGSHIVKPLTHIYTICLLPTVYFPENGNCHECVRSTKGETRMIWVITDPYQFYRFVQKL